MSNIPLNTYKNKAPFIGKVLSCKRIVGPDATGETCHIIINHEGKMPYWEGQSYGVIPPGINPKNGKPNSVRLYSIASSRYGDDMTGMTGSLCVRRAVYVDPETGKEDDSKKGVCSNFLCDSKPGTELTMTGPSGKVMLMPEQDPKTDLIMVATGTGIAPYRGFIRRLFVEKVRRGAARRAWRGAWRCKSAVLTPPCRLLGPVPRAPPCPRAAQTPAAAAYKGQAWLFLGVANSDSLLYDDEWQASLKTHPSNFRLDYALSREQNNKKGGKMYIQDKVRTRAR